MGNRTEVRVNGTVSESRSYDAADQVEGWTYDAAGNLRSDGTTTYTYDALHRLLTVRAGLEQRSSSYNGDGTLVQQSANGVQTSFTQDLAAPLSQILQTTQGGAATNYLYGRERLASGSGSTRTWYLGDALGSVRGTLDESGSLLGTPLSPLHYDPWGCRRARPRRRRSASRGSYTTRAWDWCICAHGGTGQLKA